MATGFVFHPALTLDGLLTFLGGLLAFFVIWRQTRHSDIGLESQLKAEKDARAEEQARRTRSVARAILFEIDGFYRAYLRDVRGSLENVVPEASPLPFAKSVGAGPFPVYSGNTSELGALDDEYVEAIVHFYGAADGYLRTVSDFKAFRDRLFIGQAPVGVENLARAYLKQMKDSIPEMIKLAYLVCHKLCALTGVPFAHPRVAVAAENTSIEQIVAGLQGPEGSADPRERPEDPGRMPK